MQNGPGRYLLRHACILVWLTAPVPAGAVLSTPETAPGFVAHALSAVVAYVPGHDGHRNLAPPADLGDCVQVRMTEEIEVDLAGFSAASVEIGTVHCRTDKIIFNGPPLQKAKLAPLTRDPQHVRDKRRR